MQTGALAVAGLLVPPALAGTRPTIQPALFHRALAARDRHASRISQKSILGIVDFNASSSVPRFHIVDLHGGRISSLLVAHGRGSDPEHTGWLERFSNDFGSAASSAGAYLTADGYEGEHGRSRRLIGLDRSNSNARDRAIVIHAAWYVSPQVIEEHGKLGRSEGCLAVSQADLDQVLTRLGPGHLIYADKI